MSRNSLAATLASSGYHVHSIGPGEAVELLPPSTEMPRLNFADLAAKGRSMVTWQEALGLYRRAPRLQAPSGADEDPKGFVVFARWSEGREEARIYLLAELDNTHLRLTEAGSDERSGLPMRPRREVFVTEAEVMETLRIRGVRTEPIPLSFDAVRGILALSPAKLEATDAS